MTASLYRTTSPNYGFLANVLALLPLFNNAPSFTRKKKCIFIDVLNPSSRPCREIHALTFTRRVQLLFTELGFQSLKEQQHTSFSFIYLEATVCGLFSLLQ